MTKSINKSHAVISYMYVFLQSDLSYGSILAKDVVHLLCGDLKGEVPVEVSY